MRHVFEWELHERSTNTDLAVVFMDPTVMGNLWFRD